MTLAERRILILLAAVNFTHILDFMIMMPLGPQLMQIFQITPKQFAWAVSAYSVTAGISGFIAAFFVDRFDRKQILLSAYIGFILGTFCCALAPTYALLVLARIVAGFFGGMIGAQVLSIVSDSVPFERRGQAMGILMTAFSAASVFGVPFSLWMVSKTSWHAPFWTVGIIGLLNIMLLWVYLPNMTKHLEAHYPKMNPLQTLKEIGSNKNQLWALTLSAVMMLGHFAIIPFIAPAMVRNVGLRDDQLYLIYLVGGILTFFTAPLVGKLADRVGKYPVFAAFACLSLIPVWLITNLWPLPMYAILTVIGLFFIFINGRMIPMQALVSSVALPHQRGAFMGINSSITQLFSGLASSIAGFLVVENAATGRLDGYPLVGYLSMAFILVCLYLAKQVRPVQ
jgi:MFS transporter, DHA1 family, inner membrane transport protein